MQNFFKILILVIGILAVIMVLIQKPQDGGMQGVFATGTEDGLFSETKEIGIDKLLRIITWVIITLLFLAIILYFIFT